MFDQKKTIEFYDKESAHYSAKRYAEVPSNYYQYLFTKRLKILLSFLKEIEPVLPHDARLLEIGCADGILIKAIEQTFPGRFASMVGVDISPKMIEEAKRVNNNPRAEFLLRDDLTPAQFDVVIELGVPIPDLSAELVDVKRYIKDSGYFFFCLAGRNSLHTRFKLSHIVHLDNLKTYADYDKVIHKHFKFVCSRLYAFFIPKLWTWPKAARWLQPFFDTIFQKITPELFHEKIYLLKKEPTQ